MMVKELWKPVEGFRNYYEASNCGRVRSTAREVLWHMKDEITRSTIKKLRVLKTRIAKDGYVDVLLYAAPKKRQRCFVHRLVAKAFLGTCPPGHECAHLNGDRADNHIENLRWVSRKENISHKRNHGTWPSGENNGNAKLNWGKVAEIREKRVSGRTLQSLADEYGVTNPAIYLIVSGKTWPKTLGQKENQ